MRPTVDLLVVDCDVATMVSGPVPYGLVHDGAVAIQDGLIEYVGAASGFSGTARETWSVGGRLVSPGLVDCHTHLIFGGHRAAEFEMRLGGESYEAIARRGGGIASTVSATRSASTDELADAARRRLQWLSTTGVSTVEIKSGYGLDVEHELRMLRVARALGEEGPIRITTTLLAAHAVPPEFAGRADDYVDMVCGELIPAVVAEGLADAVDAFCEQIAFTSSQVERVFSVARDHGLPVKLHAEQLSNQGGAALAARFRALSADHLEHVDEAGVRALADAGTVAVLLPGASAFLDESMRPPVDLLREHEVPMAVATDLNPGTAPLASMPLALNLACTRFGLTPLEALAGGTRVAAAALGLDDVGSLEVGARADVAVWDVVEPAELCYWFGADMCAALLVDGRRALDRVSFEEV